MLQGRRSARPPDVVGVLDLQKARVSCQTYLVENRKEMFLFDLETLTIWGQKSYRNFCNIVICLLCD